MCSLMVKWFIGVKQLKIVNVLHSFVWKYVKYTNMEDFAETVTYVTGFAKWGLKNIHPNFQLWTCKWCNSACIWRTALKFGDRIFTSLHLYNRKFQLNSLLRNEVMALQSGKIGCMYKTPFANLVTYTMKLHTCTIFPYIHLCTK